MIITTTLTDPQYFATEQQDFAFDGAGSAPSDPEYHASRSQWDVFPMGAGSAADPGVLDSDTQLDVEPYGFTEITFVTISPPTLQNLSPFPGETGVDAHANIELEIVDPEGVDAASVVLHVEGVLAWSGDSQQPGFQVTKSAVTDGLRYVINPHTPLPTSDTITIDVYAKDASSFESILDTFYTFSTEPTEPIVLSDLTPANGTEDVEPFTAVEFNLTDLNDDVLPGGTIVTINGVVAFSGVQGVNGFVGLVEKIFNGYHYVILPQRGYPYGSTVELIIHGEDYVGSVVDSATVFRIAPADICFEGPLTVFENMLLAPFEQHPALEQLRLAMLSNLVADLNVVGATRGIYLRAFETDLFPMLARLVPTPTDTLRDAYLCAWVPAVEVFDELRARLPRLLEVSTRELSALGLPVEYTDTIRRYANIENEPTVLINLACFLLVMGKALTNPDLV